jgi:hypothetical protein
MMAAGDRSRTVAARIGGKRRLPILSRERQGAVKVFAKHQGYSASDAVSD